MRLVIKVTLDAGGTVEMIGENLDAESVNELFTILQGYTIESTSTVEEEE